MLIQKLRLRLILLLGGLLLYGFFRISAGALNPQTTDIIVGSKDFTESLILAELYSLSFEKAGYHVTRKYNLGGTLIVHEALKRGEIDFYPEYTGTGLINVLQKSPSADRSAIFQTLSTEYARRWHLRWLPPSRANNSQGLVVTRIMAEQYDIHTLSQLAKVAPELRLATLAEFAEREDGLKGLRRVYGGLRFKQSSMVDNGLKYRVLLNNQADVTVAFTTDGELANPDLVLLKDDRHFWPPYQVAPVMRERIAQKFPPLVAIAEQVSNRLDTASLQRLNAAVDLQHGSYRDVAAGFLAQEVH